MYKRFGKRMIDLILSLIGFVLSFPILLIIVLVIKVDDPGPAIYKQKRIGKNKTYFYLYKFRSMKQNTPELPTHLLANPDQYISRVGRFLRKSSLDELPQLINIIKGEMSLIGPRPALWSQEDLVAERDKYGANDVRPGLSGWAQINGRDELEIPIKAQLDGEYVERMSLLFDIKCLLETVAVVFRRTGVVEGMRKPDGDTKGNKKTLLVITNHSYMLWRFRRHLLQELQKEYDVVISTPFVGHEKDFEKLDFRMIETRLERRSINPLGELKLIFTYSRLLKREAPDLVLTYSIKPNIYAGWLCRMKKIPYVVNVQGLGTSFQKKGIAFVATCLYRIALRNAGVVFFENEENAEVFCEKQIVSHSLRVVLPGAGICLEEYPLLLYPQEEKVHFLYLGRIMKEKGIDELLGAVKKLRESFGESFVLDLVGFYEDAYKEQVEELERSGIGVFHGFQEDPRPYYCNAHCVVLPSYHEGLSNVLLEAAATGRPIITSDIPGCRETVEPGKSGLLCVARDVDSLYEQMKAFMELTYEQRKAMGIAGRNVAEDRFEKKKVVEKTCSEMRMRLGGQV